MSLKKKLGELLMEEDGQTTVEYILILAVILTVFMQFRKKLMAVVLKLFKALDEGTDAASQFESF